MSSENLYSYEVFNFNFLSSNLQLPDLKKVKNSKKSKILIREENSNNWPEIDKGMHDTFYLRMQKNDLRLQIEGVGKYRINNGENIAWEKENNKVQDKDILAFLVGSAFGAILIQNGLYVLHGNALVKDNKAIVCIGHSGYGKSTLAYSLINAGWKLVADDLVALTPQLKILPGIPTIKLWLDAVRAFGLDERKLKPIREGINKYFFIPNPNNLSIKSCDLNAIYLLSDKPKGKIDIEDFEFINNDRSEKKSVSILLNHSYRPRFVRGMEREGDYFMAFSKLQRTVPLIKLNLPNGIRNLQKLVEKHDFIK